MHQLTHINLQHEKLSLMPWQNHYAWLINLEKPDGSVPSKALLRRAAWRCHTLLATDSYRWKGTLRSRYI